MSHTVTLKKKPTSSDGNYEIEYQITFDTMKAANEGSLSLLEYGIYASANAQPKNVLYDTDNGKYYLSLTQTEYFLYDPVIVEKNVYVDHPYLDFLIDEFIKKHHLDKSNGPLAAIEKGVKGFQSTLSSNNIVELQKLVAQLGMYTETKRNLLLFKSTLNPYEAIALDLKSVLTKVRAAFDACRPPVTQAAASASPCK
jgi:hypothetical protein